HTERKSHGSCRSQGVFGAGRRTTLRQGRPAPPNGSAATVSAGAKIGAFTGAELFRRTSRQVELTVAGQTLIEPARDLVAAADRAVESVKSTMTGQIGTVSLGFAGASSNAEVA